MSQRVGTGEGESSPQTRHPPTDSTTADGRAASSQAGRSRRELWGVVALSAIVAAVASYWSHLHGLQLAHSDAVTHLNIARRVLDSQTPGVAQLGTVWLPVPHILMQPFIYSDFLWHTGLAGSIVGYVCFVATAVALFLSIRLITQHQPAAWIGLAAFLSNPNALYLQTTALTEPVLLVSMTASGYFLLRWGRRGAYQDLLLAGTAAAVAVGSRYDGWAFALVSAGLVLLTSYLGSRDPKKAEGATLAYLAIPVYAMFLWFFFNWLIFGDPLEFARGEYSAAYQQQQIARSGGLPTQHDAILSLLTYSWAVIDNVGWLVMTLAAVGLLVHLLSTRLRPDSLVVYSFLAAYPFNVLSLWLGQTTIVTPHSTPPGYFNVRYGALLLPAAALFLAYLTDFLTKHLRPGVVMGAMSVVLAGQFALWIPGWPTSIVSVADGLIGVSARPPSTEAARYLHDHYDRGSILIDDANSAFIIFDSGIGMREYIGTFSGELWKRALDSPGAYAEWIVMRPGDPQDRVAARVDRGELERRYTVVFESEGLALYRRKGP